LLGLSPRDALRYLGESSAIVKEMISLRDVYRKDRYKLYRDLVVEATYRAGSRYIPAPYPGRILLFLAGGLQVGADLDTRMVWCDVARDRCQVFRTSASDIGGLLKTPHLRALANSLTEQLREFSTVSGSSSVSGLLS
jgi:hypothetical protein